MIAGLLKGYNDALSAEVRELRNTVRVLRESLHLNELRVHELERNESVLLKHLNLKIVHRPAETVLEKAV